MARSTRLLTQKEVASFLDISPRWVRDLEAKGILPTQALGEKKFYPWPAANHAYIRYRESLKEGPGVSTYEEARTRKMLAEAELAELKAAELRGSLMRVTEHVHAVARIYDFLRNRVLSLPGYWNSQIVGLKDLREAGARLRILTTELLEDLTAAAPEIEEFAYTDIPAVELIRRRRDHAFPEFDGSRGEESAGARGPADS